MDHSHDETEYSHLGDEDFLDVLRKHLPDRSWTFGQWHELERRGFDVVDQDSDLKAAIDQERQKLNAAFQKALEPVRRQLFGSLEPLQRQLADLVGSAMPKADLAALIPGMATSALIDPGFIRLGTDLFPPSIPSTVAEPDFVRGGQPATAVVDELAAWQEKKMRHEAEVRRAQLETAASAAAQVKVMERVETAVSEAAKHGWYDWAVLILAAIAAVASVIAILR